MSERTTVHLLRHGEVHNPGKILYGRLPGFRLSTTGEAMALAAAEWFAGRDITHLVSSPLERAQQTAAPLAEALSLPVAIDDRLIEAGNAFEGLAVAGGAGVLRAPGNWWKLRNPFRPSWGEPYVEIAARMLAAVEAARDAARGHEAVLVSHQLPIWTAAAARRGTPVRARPAPPAVRPGQRHVPDLRRRPRRRGGLRRAGGGDRPTRPGATTPGRSAGAPRSAARAGGAWRCSPARPCCSTGSDAVDVNNGGEFRFVQGTPSGEVIPEGSGRPRRTSSGALLGSGDVVDSSMLDGQIGVLNFWGSWCAPCRVETPEFSEVAADLADDGVQFLGINVKETDEQFATAFVDRFHIHFPSLYDPRGEVALAFRDYPANAIPSTIVLDPQGRVAAVYTGAVSQEDLRTVLDRVRGGGVSRGGDLPRPGHRRPAAGRRRRSRPSSG